MCKEKEKDNGDLIGFHEVFDRLWKCRDFELATLWQRSVLLGTFMLATYAGYGMMILNVFEKSYRATRWDVLNLVAIGMCGFGVLLSVLWVMMLKGSKAWYEIYERAIEDFRTYWPEAFRTCVMTSRSVQCSELAGFGIVWIKRHKTNLDFSGSLVSGAAGCYSVSRVAILIGQTSLIGWLGLVVVHLLFLLVGYETVVRLCDSHDVMVGVAVVLLGTLFIAVLKSFRSAQSSTLKVLSS